MVLGVEGIRERTMMSLREAATSGVKWSTVSQIGRQAIQLVTVIILARLLSPADFGLMGMATAVIAFAEAFNDLGTSTAVIQRKEQSDELLSSIFWVHLAFGALATAFFLAFSPLFAYLYREPRISHILRVLSVTCLISGVGLLQRALMERDLAFDRLAKAEIAGVAVGSIVGTVSALLGAGVWSFVYLSLAMVTVTTVLFWASSGWRPKMTFCWVAIRSVSSYSLNLTGAKVLSYFARNADYLLIGRFLGAQALGLYSLAYRIMLFPLENTSGVIGRVMFPVYSRFRDDDARFRLAYLRVASTIALITFPLMLGLMAVSEEFVLSIFGSQWVALSVLLMILAPVGMIQSITTTVGAIYQAKARTDWMLRWGIGSGALLVLAFVVGLRWGIVGVSAAYAIAYGLLVYPLFAIPFRLIGLPFHDLVGAIWRPFVASLIMSLVIAGLKLVLAASLTSGWLLVLLVPTGALVYFLVSWFISRAQVREVMSLVLLRG